MCTKGVKSAARSSSLDNHIFHNLSQDKFGTDQLFVLETVCTELSAILLSANDIDEFYFLKLSSIAIVMI